MSARPDRKRTRRAPCEVNSYPLEGASENRFPAAGWGADFWSFPARLAVPPHPLWLPPLQPTPFQSHPIFARPSRILIPPTLLQVDQPGGGGRGAGCGSEDGAKVGVGAKALRGVGGFIAGNGGRRELRRPLSGHTKGAPIVDPGTQGSALALIWGRTPGFRVPDSQTGLELALSKTFTPTAGILLSVFSVGRKLASLLIHGSLQVRRRNPGESTNVSGRARAGAGKGKAEGSEASGVGAAKGDPGSNRRILRSGPISAGLLEVEGWGAGVGGGSQAETRGLTVGVKRGAGGYI